ncbi:hypothetical protein LIER_15686 [Lithospermum erythrorhizon]|uniref:Uncharacterized protein n=1 Tax=Lithospermum erythrorhizon TaxID=34254 RepID=A0AAV3Q485_LITER
MSKGTDISDPSANPYVEDTTDVSQADMDVTGGLKTPSTEDLNDKAEPSIKHTMNELKSDSTSREDMLQPTINDSTKDTVVKSMTVDIPSVTDTDTEPAENMERSTIGQGGDDIMEVSPEDVGQKKKFKKRKHKKSANVGESFEAKRKLSKEERVAKRARKAERRARRTT